MTRVLVTVVFTDIVGSTELRSRVGDDEADRVVARHDAVVGELVPAHGGQVVKYLGDGALATFSSAVDATVASSAIQARLAGSAPAVRIGIHAGDVETSDGDVAGLPVAVASRLCGIAPSGGVVVSGPDSSNDRHRPSRSRRMLLAVSPTLRLPARDSRTIERPFMAPSLPRCCAKHGKRSPAPPCVPERT